MESLGILAQSMSPEQAVAFIRQAQPRLWIFCSTVEVATLIHLAGCVQRYSPRRRLLLIEGSESSGVETPLFHRVIGAGADPDSLVSVVEDFRHAA